MLKLYIMVMDSSIELKKITEIFDKSDSIEFWFFNLPNSIFIKTKISAKDINKLVNPVTNDKAILITEISKTNYSGRILTEHAKYFENITQPTVE